jgi:hypothetical protein
MNTEDQKVYQEIIKEIGIPPPLYRDKWKPWELYLIFCEIDE